MKQLVALLCLANGLVLVALAITQHRYLRSEAARIDQTIANIRTSASVLYTLDPKGLLGQPYNFYDDRTNLVLTVIHTNGTWEAVKP